MLIDFKTNQPQLLKMDNLTIKDKMPAPKVSIIGKFHCTVKPVSNRHFGTNINSSGLSPA